MKVAIPTVGTRVDEHFGHARTFTIFTLNDASEVVETETFFPPSGCGCQSTVGVTMQAKGVSTLLVGNIGQGAINKMAEHGITVLRGCEGEIRDVLARWTNGEIKDQNILCNHEGCTH
jgi:predicted Fe-Mo cluster-binding NifX family protein